MRTVYCLHLLVIIWAAACINVNATGQFKVTPLHVAAASGNLSTTLTLLKAGANVNARVDSGSMALSVAEVKIHTEIANLILEYGGRDE